MERYIFVERYADNGELSHRALVDSIDGRELGTDGGEPEDQSFWRDWAWVPDELNKVQATVEALQKENRELNLTLSRCEKVFDRAKVEYQGDTELSLRQFFVKYQALEKQVEALQLERDEADKRAEQ